MHLVDTTTAPFNAWGYDRATLLLAWSYSRARGVELLFGRIELRPTELAHGGRSRQLLEKKISSTSGRHVWVGIHEMSAGDGEQWYVNALHGTWTVPPALVPAGRSPPPHEPLGPAMPEPVWPQLNLAPRPYVALPCIPARMECPRVHHRLVVSPRVAEEDGWTAAERMAAGAALAPILGFDLVGHPHLWGSLRLILPNPVLRHVGTRLVPDGDREAVGLTLIPRVGASLADLRVTLWEERDRLLLPLAQFTPSNQRVLVRAEGLREATAMTIDSHRLGRLYLSDPASFIRAAKLSINVISSRRDVRAARPGKPDVRYSVDVHGEPSISTVGAEKHGTAIDILRPARWKHDEHARDQSDEQIWFSGDVDAAQERLRALVSKATSRVWVVDYFFDGADAGILLPAIGALKAEIRVLTSREGLGAGKRSLHARAHALAEVADRLRSEFRMQPIEIRAMSGRAEIHDRFLVVDDHVYLLGSSINSYGERGTMLVRLRSTPAVLDAITGAWKRAQPLRDLTVAPDLARAARVKVLIRAGLRRLLTFLDDGAK